MCNGQRYGFFNHRQHDVRMSLNQLRVVSPSHPLSGVTQRMLTEVSFSEPGTLRLIPCTKEWNVNFIRHKKRTSYVLDEKYITTVSSVDEYTVDMKHPKWKPITIKPEDYSNHTEVEVRSVHVYCMALDNRIDRIHFFLETYFRFSVK